MTLKNDIMMCRINNQVRCRINALAIELLVDAVYYYDDVAYYDDGTSFHDVGHKS
jgi:hypothetical protein